MSYTDSASTKRVSEFSFIISTACLVVLLVITVLGFLVGFILVIASNNKAVDPLYNMSEISSSDMEFGELYKIDELYVLDSYCTVKSDDELTYCCLVAFTDKNQEYYNVATLVVEESDDIYEQISDYVKDSNAYWGDLMLSCCVSRRNFPQEKSVKKYYESCKNDLISEGIFYENEFQDLTIRYRYDGSYTAEDIAADKSSANLGLGLMCIIMGALFGVVSLIMCFSRSRFKKIAKSQDECDYRKYLKSYQEYNKEQYVN